jgi:hypothetical protein
MVKPLQDMVEPQSRDKGTGKVAPRPRYDFAAQVYDACRSPGAAKLEPLAPLRSTWLPTLRAAIQHARADVVSRQEWVAIIASAILAAGIEWVPGTSRGKPTHKSILRLVGQAKPASILAAPEGSLKRAALEAEYKAELSRKTGGGAARRQVIDFNSAIPFEQVPTIIMDGFSELGRLFSRPESDKRILGHYHAARMCLEECLGDPLCDLMLMMVLTLSSSSATPVVEQNAQAFSTDPGKTKAPHLLAANMATRMLWHLRPGSFDWVGPHKKNQQQQQATGEKKSQESSLSIPEMTKKIGKRETPIDRHGEGRAGADELTEHKGVSNRVLRQLGWVTSTSSRDSPQNADLRLRPAEELYALRKELLGLRKNPAAFIAKIFGSSDAIWVERCSSIIAEREGKAR